MWPLATATVIAVAVTELVGACRDVPIRRWAGRLAAPPAGARVLLALTGLALRGPRIGLFCVLVAEVLSLCLALARLGRLGRCGLPTTVRACRDDGAVARWAGRLVRGSLPPLPPAIAGTCATVLLAILGLRAAVGFISLAPVVALMLAAPGAGNPHEGRFDWLVPAVMALGQYVYLAALGVAWSVPAPVVFILCALTAAWYAGLAAQPGGPPGIGWEVRLTLTGLAAVFGIATVGYVVLATYLAVLIGRRALAVSEDAVDRPGARGRGQQAASPRD
jgi:hypothetical protein